MFSRARAEALDGTSADTVWIECGAKPDVNPMAWPAGQIDWQAFEDANPAYPHRTSRAAIMRMARRLSKASLKREGLGIWDTVTTVRPEIPGAIWEPLRVEAAPEGAPAYGIKFSTDGTRVALAAAVADEETEAIHVEVIAEKWTEEGLDWLKHWLVERWRGCRGIVIDGRSGAGELREALLARDVARSRITLPDVGQVITAHGAFLEAVRGERLTHFDQAELNQAVEQATRRRIGNAGGWGWEGIGGANVLPLEAATYAHYGALRGRTKRVSAPRRLY